MGQYYALSCPQTATYVSAAEMGSFLKAVEQFGSIAMPSMLAYLVSAGRGEHPRDLPWAPQGDWAGRMVLMIGDYAEDGDLLNPAFPCDEVALYMGKSDTQQKLGRGPSRRKKTMHDLSAALLPIYERVHGLRSDACDIDGKEISSGWGTEFYPIARDASGAWGIDLSAFSPKDKEQALEFYERTGAMDNEAIRRGPVSNFEDCFDPIGDVPETLPSADEGQGDPMLWVNLDRMEYIDPATFGDTPDLAGIMTGNSARPVLAMITHFEGRGGGDFHDAGPLDIVGRWRGDRIVLMGSRGFEGVTPEDVRTTGVDITGRAFLYADLKRYFGTSRFEDVGAPSETLTKAQSEALDIAAKDPAVVNVLLEQGKGVRFRLIPKMHVPSHLLFPSKVTEDVHLAPVLEVYAPQGGKICLSKATHLAMQPLLAKGRSCAVSAKKDRSGQTIIDVSPIIVRTVSNNHQIIKALAA